MSIYCRLWDQGCQIAPSSPTPPDAVSYNYHTTTTETLMRITRVVSAVAILLIAACASIQRGPAATRYDILITNARIVDGTGNPWFRGAVAIRADRIAYVGPAIADLAATRVIDAHDQVVSPGFIDMLGHSEFELLRGPHAISKITQGITSEVTGEVHSAWPQVALGDRPDPRYPWRSLGEYFATLEKNGIAINLGTYVGTSSVRETVMGEATRHPTESIRAPICFISASVGWRVASPITVSRTELVPT